MPVLETVITYVALKFTDQFIKDEGYGRLKRFFFPAKKYKHRLTEVIYDTIKEFEKTPYAARLKACGVIVSYICPLMYMNNPLCGKTKMQNLNFALWVVHI